ncbi:hypothetical protein BDN70DRAFT_378180 [Pholiota conissans]|uniref:Uncharacterized protein n=1 Tax=Pholiota conissans TaxID=109636 RepID=A0A9P5YPF6_9AGAR|nr:hypothetical protein BDN70DRAFT_378180 [Pholiota conissans]
MSMATLPDLPEELLEEISTFFDNGNTADPLVSEPNNTYRAMASTCKSLRAHYQRRLFSIIHLSTHHRVSHLQNLIDENSVLASYIRIINLEVDSMSEGMFQFPPLLAVLRAVNMFVPPTEIHLRIGSFWKHPGSLYSEVFNGLTHITDAPTSILHAVTRISDGDSRVVLPISTIKRFVNLRELDTRNVVFVDFKSSEDRLEAEDSTSYFPRSKLDVFAIMECNPSVIDIFNKEIFDFSALKMLSFGGFLTYAPIQYKHYASTLILTYLRGLGRYMTSAFFVIFRNANLPYT